MSNGASISIVSLSLRASVRVPYSHNFNTFVERATKNICNHQCHPSLNRAASTTLVNHGMVLNFSRFILNFRAFRIQPRARRQAGTTKRAAAVSAGAGAAGQEEPLAVTGESIDVSAAATSTTPVTTTSQLIASLAADKVARAASQGPPSWKMQDVPELPGASVAEGAGREANGVKKANNNSNKDGMAGDKEQYQGGRTPGTPSGSAVDVALLGMMKEAASTKKMAEQKEKEDSSLTDKLDLAVRRTDHNRVQRLPIPSQPPLQHMCELLGCGGVVVIEVFVLYNKYDGLSWTS